MREKNRETLERIMAGNFLRLSSDSKSQSQEVQRISHRANDRKHAYQAQIAENAAIDSIL